MKMIRTVEVINLKTCKNWGQSGDVRIDRKTKWGNPYEMLNKSEAERNRVCDLYEETFIKRGLDITDLKNAKRLGCWCKPLRCHGDYLKKQIEDYNDPIPPTL